MKADLAQAFSGGDSGAIELMIVRKDGSTFPAVAHASAIVRDDVVLGIRGILFDISNLKEAEQALVESEHRFFPKRRDTGQYVLVLLAAHERTHTHGVVARIADGDLRELRL